MGRGGGGGKGGQEEVLEQLKSMRLPRGLGAAAVLAGGAGMLALAATSGGGPLYVVQGGFRAVKFNVFTGLNPLSYGPGTHLRVPFLERVYHFDCRQQPITINTATGSRDLQIVNCQVRVLFKANQEQLPELYRRLGLQYHEVVLPSIGNEVLKSVIAQFNASDLITRRSEVSSRITQELTSRSRDFFVDIMDVSITQMNFGKEYMRAVEEKQIAQQMAERARFKVEQAQQEKKGAIILAEGEAESAALIGKSMKDNPAFLELRRIEAAKSISQSIAKSQNRVMADADTLLFNLREPFKVAKA
eukprot:TRINITY_DN55819_c0_g1_i1.p1 TRINITY_DN55819_c0_g1~~TRINITY_DN55819_c0_g1_i1.p1  ORF type:complete len:330 (+),score=136.20 TRINITY_DN55819_c0_g1_i1:83-991(+)